MKGIGGNNNIIISYNDKIEIVKIKSLPKYLSKNYIFTPTFSFEYDKTIWTQIESISFEKKRDLYNLTFVNNFSVELTKENSFFNLRTGVQKFSKKNKSFSRLINEFNNKKITKYIGLYSKIPFNYKVELYLKSILLGISLTDYAYISPKYIHFKLTNQEKINYIISILNKLNINYEISKRDSLSIVRIKNIYNFSLRKNNYCDFSINYLGLLEGFINLSSLLFIEYKNKIPFLVLNTSQHHIMNLIVFAFSTYGVRTDINYYDNFNSYYEIKSTDRFLMDLLNNIYLRDGLKKCLNNEKIPYKKQDYYTQTLLSYKKKKNNTIYNLKLKDSNNVLIGINGFIPIVIGD